MSPGSAGTDELFARRTPRQAAYFLRESLRAGGSVALRPELEPRLIVQEELPVVDDPMPHKEKRHGRLERPEARVVDRSRLIALVVRPEQDPILDVRRNRKLLEDVGKGTLRTIGR